MLDTPEERPVFFSLDCLEVQRVSQNRQMKKIAVISFIVGFSLAALAKTEKAKPKVIHGSLTTNDSPANEQILLSSVRIGLVPANNGEHDLSRFRAGCSGTITGTSQIATAAHCFSMPTTGLVYYAEVRTSINPDTRKFIRLSSVQTAKDIDEIMNITSKDAKTRGLDLATATLDGTVDAKNITPICGSNNVRTDSQYKVAGFGVTESGVASKDLRDTSVKMQQVNEGTFFSQPNRDQEKNSAACYADSGGGLFVTDKDKKKACLAGTVSGHDLGGGGNTQNPVELCTRPNLRQVFARATSKAMKGLNVEKTFEKNPPPIPKQDPVPGFQGTLPPGTLDEDLEAETPIEY